MAWSIQKMTDFVARRWREQVGPERGTFNLLAMEAAEKGGYPLEERQEIAREICREAGRRRGLQMKRRAKKKPVLSEREKKKIFSDRARELADEANAERFEYRALRGEIILTPDLEGNIPYFPPHQEEISAPPTSSPPPPPALPRRNIEVRTAKPRRKRVVDSRQAAFF